MAEYGIGSGQSGNAGSASTDPAETPTKVNANDPAAGSPASFAGFQPGAERPNIFIDEKDFKQIEIEGVLLPGIIVEVDGCSTPEEWSQQKGTGGNFATSTWKGAKLAEKIKIKMAFSGPNAFDKIYDVRNQLRPTRGQKPPSLRIKNAFVNFGGIHRIVVADIGFPKWEKSGGYATYEIELNEYNPAADAKTGPADPAKATDGSTPGGAQGAESKYVLGKAKGA